MPANLDTIAFATFRAWVSRVRQQIPAATILEEDEKKIVIDFERVVQVALQSALERYGKRPKNLTYSTALGYIKGYVLGEIAMHWSFKYLPASSRLDYQIWFLAFKQYAELHEPMRLAVNRLYTYLKNAHFSPQDPITAGRYRF